LLSSAQSPADRFALLGDLVMRDSATIIDLLSDPTRAARLAEKERRAKANDVGFLGLLPRVNKQLALMLGGEATEIEVHPLSPTAHMLRSGDWIRLVCVPSLSIEVPLENFDGLRLPAGTAIEIEFLRIGAIGKLAGWNRTSFKLAKWPAIKPWQRHPRVDPGQRVAWGKVRKEIDKERGKYLADMRRYLHDLIPGPAFASAYNCLEVLVREFDNLNEPGCWPRYSTLGKRVGLKKRRMIDLVAMLRWFGCIKLIEGPTLERQSNVIAVCWPLRGQPAVQPPPLPPKPSPAIRRVRLGGPKP
jgi:hypothetical protein